MRFHLKLRICNYKVLYYFGTLNINVFVCVIYRTWTCYFIDNLNLILVGNTISWTF